MTSKLLLLLLLLLVSGAWSYPSANQQPESVAIVAQRPILLIQNEMSPEDSKNYEITIPKDVKPGEPCLTISWKTNPDGTGPGDPKIYMVNGYFRIVPASAQMPNQQ
ncbi:uncharacterized protein LOC6556812 isoform X2 [Drosophila grimshawi]|uniref:uncharacterized protein LOC6556812 isoform X2 n=1 Tax=Drosophila grimshawi TaxID=7222 RepID=UPI000C87130A|nr:uncharacterized protein LOC6556812 isoform X2 [Drosophila grimshawi]